VSLTLDAHVHVWDRKTDPQPWIDPATMGPIDRDFSFTDAERMLDSVTLDRAIVVQSSNSAPETERLLRGATDRIAGVVGWLDLTQDVPRQLDGLEPAARGRLVGIRHLVHIDPDPEWLARPDVTHGLAALGDEGLKFDVVARWWQLPLVAKVASALPEVTFVLDHLGGPPIGTEDMAAWAASLADLARRDNVVAKLSGVAGEVGSPDWTPSQCIPAIEAALDAFGPGRLMYGSDWPMVELVGGAAKWHAAARAWVASLAPAESRAVFGATATTTYLGPGSS
jgi:L-fuconolactonase